MPARGDDLERLDREKLLSAAHVQRAARRSRRVENHYFLSAIAPDDGDGAALRAAGLETAAATTAASRSARCSRARVEHKQVALAPGAEPHLPHARVSRARRAPTSWPPPGTSSSTPIESGWFASLAEWLTWLLRRIHDFVGNWGIAIILLTFVVKLVLFPLTAQQMQSMAKMKELKPEIDRINELYGDDREKKGAAMMELYRKRGVNPMAGCFPVLLQLPIWFSLYASLSSNVELFRAPFALWWQDLSSPDPYFVLPLALGVLMFVQQKMSPATGMDPVQQKVMLYMMPAMITSFMLFLPAGLCLYMFTNSALSILQQRVIEAAPQQDAARSPLRKLPRSLRMRSRRTPRFPRFPRAARAAQRQAEQGRTEVAPWQKITSRPRRMVP